MALSQKLWIQRESKYGILSKLSYLLDRGIEEAQMYGQLRLSRGSLSLHPPGDNST